MICELDLTILYFLFTVLIVMKIFIFIRLGKVMDCMIVKKKRNKIGINMLEDKYE